MRMLPGAASAGKVYCSGPVTGTNMKPKPVAIEETPEQVAESIGVALDFLLGEAKAAGLTEIGELLRFISAKAKERAALNSLRL